MPFDVAAWADDLGLVGDERTQAIALLSKPDRLEKLEKGQLRLSDYSRSMNKLKQDQDAIDAARTKAEEDIEAERGTLTTWRTHAEGKLTAAEKARDAAEAKLFAIEQKARKLADDNGVDPVEYFKLDPEQPLPKKKDDDKPVFDQEGFRKEMGTSLVGVARLPALMMKLNSEHRKLFGEDIPDPDKIVDAVLGAQSKGQNLSLQDAWEGQYKVAEKRAAVQQADIDRRIAEGVEAGIRTKLETMELGTKAPDDLSGSPILNKFGRKPADQNKNDNPRHNGETAAEIATRAFRAGKYRKEAQGAARAALAG